jgi:hypothetical protein
MKFIHLSDKPYKKFVSSKILGVIKPKGLWLAPKGVWEEYAKVELSRKSHKHIYEFNIDTDKLIILKTYKGIKNFNDTYGIEDKYKNHFVDWKRAAKETGKSGVYVKNALIKKARQEFMWYYAFDVESICIWNKDAINSFEEIAF